MIRTASQIQGDIFRLLKGSTLEQSVSGNIYRDGYRPRDSRLEDIIVIFTTGFPDEIQEGVVTLNIYVPDIDPFGNGVLCKDGERVETLEALAQEWVDSLNVSRTFYKLKLSQTIHSVADESIHQHFVVVRLNYKFFDNN